MMGKWRDILLGFVLGCLFTILITSQKQVQYP